MCRVEVCIIRFATLESLLINGTHISVNSVATQPTARGEVKGLSSHFEIQTNLFFPWVLKYRYILAPASFSIVALTISSKHVMTLDGSVMNSLLYCISTVTEPPTWSILSGLTSTTVTEKYASELVDMLCTAPKIVTRPNSVCCKDA
jgi:hypothetical protein